MAARRPVYAGKATAEVEFTDDSLKVITVRPRSAKASEPDTARSAEVAQATVELPEQKTALKEIIAGGGQVILCGQTAGARGISADQLLPGVQLALSAMTAMTLLQQNGYEVILW